MWGEKEGRGKRKRDRKWPVPFIGTHDFKREPQLFCGFPLVSCVVCMSECMCALINLIWDHWRKRHSLARALPNIHHLIICFHPSVQSNFADQHFSFTLRTRSYRNKQLRHFSKKLRSNLAPAPVLLNEAKAAVLVPPAALEQPLHNTHCVWSSSFPKLLWYSTQLTLVNPSYKYQEQSLSAQSSSAGLEVRAFPVF